MSDTCFKACRKFSITATLLLLFQVTFCQNNFSSLDDWVSKNLRQLGGRATLVILKDGKIIYNKSQSNLSSVQRMAIKYYFDKM